MSVISLAAGRIPQPIRRALRNDFVRHSALVFGATMAGNVLNYVFNFATSRRLGVEGFATLSSLMGGLMIVSIPASVLNLIVVKYTAEFHAVGDQAKLWRLSQNLLRWTAACAAAIFVLGLLLRGSVASFLHIPDDAAITMCVGIIALSFMMPSVRGILQGEQDFKRFSVSTSLEVALKVLLGVGLVYAGFGVFGAMAGWICGTSIALLYTVWAVRKHRAPESGPVRLSLDVQRLMRTTVGIALATGGMTLLSFMDVVLVKHYFDAHHAGLYAVVNLTGKIVLFLVSFFPMIVLPKAIAASRRGESPVRLLIMAGLGTVLMAGGTLAVFSLMPATIIHIIAGAAFVAGAAYVPQYDLAMGLLACLSLVTTYKIGLHRFDFVAPLLLIVAAEVAAIAAFHRSLWDVVHVLLAGNAVAVLVCSYKITAPLTSQRAECAPEAAA